MKTKFENFNKRFVIARFFAKESNTKEFNGGEILDYFDDYEQVYDFYMNTINNGWENYIKDNKEISEPSFKENLLGIFKVIGFITNIKNKEIYKKSDKVLLTGNFKGGEQAIDFFLIDTESENDYPEYSEIINHLKSI